MKTFYCCSLVLVLFLLAACVAPQGMPGGTAPASVPTAAPTPETSQASQSAGALTARDLTAPGALAGSSPSSFNWSPVGAALTYVMPQNSQDVLWLYDAATDDAQVLLDPAQSPGNLDVTSAQWAPDGTRLLLAGDEALWLLDVATGELAALAAGGGDTTGFMLTPDGSHVSYVQDNDLYVLAIDDGAIRRLTTDGGETVFNGALDWVYNEELATRAAQPAYAWSPDGNWLIYLRLDETAVNDDPVTDYRPVPATVSYTRYPAVGTANPVASLHALAPGALAPPLEVPLPDDAEYVLPYFTWTPDSNHALFTTVNRDHTRLSLNRWTPQSGELRTLIAETAVDWINEDRYVAPIFLGDGEQFLWLSERDGFMHLYLYAVDGTLVKQLTQGDWMIDSSAWDLLTAGRPVHVDPSGASAYFITTQVSPLERHIVRLDLASGALEQLTQEPGFHGFALSADGHYLVDQFSDVDTPPVTKIMTTDDGSATVLSAAPGPALDLPGVSREFVTVKAHDGMDLIAQLVKPADFDPNNKYPVVVHWYGGPGLQMVSNRYGTTNIFNLIERDVLYTQEGLLVWRLDNRGTFGRGHGFESPIFGELGKAALDDQLAGIEYLKTLPYVDTTRIGTDGKSFGGYMTLYALLHAPDVFDCGVAGAPPTDWSYYDTIYTERYMRTPDANPKGYAATNLIDRAGQIQARPLLIHGLADTNVHMQNIVNFIQALEADDKLFDFIPLPNLSHSFRGDGLVAALSASADYLATCLTGALPGPEQPAATVPEAEPAPPAPAVTKPVTSVVPAEAEAALQSLGPEDCAALAQAMSETLGVEVTQAEATAAGTGEQFTGPDATVLPLKDAVATLEPRDVWQNFYDLTQIPRPSHHEEQVRDFLAQFGRDLGLETIVDEVGNVLIRKPASSGMENRHAVVLQAHMDMVPQKTPDSTHDFLTDPIDAYVDGDWVVADGTSLGADDGIGVAMAMAILQSQTPLGPIEALFTVNEEDGMDGAMGLQPGVLEGDTLVNLDSEEEGVFTIGSAGGDYVDIDSTYDEVVAPDAAKAYTVTISGLQGGHSGVDIDKGRGHATKLLVRLLSSAAEQYGVRLATIQGGTAANAITTLATALVAVPNDQVNAFLAFVEQYEEIVQSELAAVESTLTVQATPASMPAAVMDETAQRALVDALYGTPQGVLRMSDAVPGLVETSTHMGLVKSADGTMAVTCLPRSSVDTQLDDVNQMIASVWDLAGIPVMISGRYSGWDPNPNSPILLLMKDVYEEMYGQEPEISAIHAGLECGTIASKHPGMDAISIGPTLQGVHTTDERLLIATVQKLDDFLVETLQQIPEKSAEESATVPPTQEVAAAVQEAAAAITATQVITYTPGPPIGEPQVGSCWTNSLAVWREEAWRCMIGSAIYDPCFADNGSVTCGASPVTNTVSFALDLVDPLPAPQIPSDMTGHAWLIELADGTVCEFATGATGGVGDERINYFCPSPAPGQSVVILGDLQPGVIWRAHWAVLTGSMPDLTILESDMAPLQTVWR